MICVENVSVQYGNKRILQDINLEIEAGKRVAIIGRNGTGKSTLLQIMAGIITPLEGTISYFGENVTSKRKRFSHYCGYVPQDNPLLEELSVLDNLRIWNGGFRLEQTEILSMNGLSEMEGERVSTLSGGMKRRLTIACAMLHMPPVMLMDEPTTALDIYYKEQIWEWMDQYQKRNGTIVMVTHDRQEMEQCDKIYEVKNKGILQGGELENE